MRFSLYDLIMPHYCCSCGAIGAPLCDHCKYNIISEPIMECLGCLRPIARYGDVCSICNLAYSRAWVAGYHGGALRELIGQYKFHSLKSASAVMASLLDEALPQLPNDVIITSVPTVRSHVRARGFDHTAIMARLLAQSRGLSYLPTLARAHNSTQRGSGRRVRIRQAANAFAPLTPLRGGTYLLIDDVCTTGATVHYAAKALRKAGAADVWVAVVSREPLD